MRSRGRSNSELGSFGNIDVPGKGQSNKFIHSQAVGMVGSGLAQRKTATRVGLTMGSSPDLNPLENLWEIFQQELCNVSRARAPEICMD